MEQQLANKRNNTLAIPQVEKAGVEMAKARHRGFLKRFIARWLAAVDPDDEDAKAQLEAMAWGNGRGMR